MALRDDSELPAQRSSSPRTRRGFWLFSIALCLFCAGTVWSGRRVLQLERGELAYRSPTRSLRSLRFAAASTRISARLASLRLRAGEFSSFEICSTDRFPKALWRDALFFMVWRADTGQLMLKAPLDAEQLDRVRRGLVGGCLMLGGGTVPQDAHYAIDAVWPQGLPKAALLDAGLQVRVLARTPLSRRDLWPILLLACAGLLGVTAGFWLSASRRDTPRRNSAFEILGSPAPELLTLFVGTAALTFAWASTTWFPLAGSTLGFMKGVGLALLEVVLAFVLVRWIDPHEEATQVLGLHGGRPLTPASRIGLGLAAPLLGWTFAGLAKWLLKLVPSTGEAPIESFISWPSGTLSFAALGMILPLGEELFFRGLLYRAAQRFGHWMAFLLPTLLFCLFHLYQLWGNWGAFASVSAVGALLTALRATTQTTLVPIVVHLAYNFTLSVAAFAGKS